MIKARAASQAMSAHWAYPCRLAPVRALARDVIYPAATGIRDTRAGQTVVIVVGSSSHATHHMAGSVPVSLNR